MESKTTEMGKCDTEIKKRIGQAKQTFQNMEHVLADNKLALYVRQKVFRFYWHPVLTCGSETWTLNKQRNGTKQLRCVLYEEFSKPHGHQRRQTKVLKRGRHRIKASWRNQDSTSKVCWPCVWNSSSQLERWTEREREVDGEKRSGTGLEDEQMEVKGSTWL